MTIRTSFTILSLIWISCTLSGEVFVIRPLVAKMDSLTAVATVVLSCSPRGDEYSAEVITGNWLNGTLPSRLKFSSTAFDWPLEERLAHSITPINYTLNMKEYERWRRLEFTPTTTYTDTFTVVFKYQPHLAIQKAILSTAILNGSGLQLGIRMYTMGNIQGMQYVSTVKASREEWHTAYWKTLQFVRNGIPAKGSSKSTFKKVIDEFIDQFLAPSPVNRLCHKFGIDWTLCENLSKNSASLSIRDQVKLYQHLVSSRKKSDTPYHWNSYWKKLLVNVSSYDDAVHIAKVINLSYRTSPYTDKLQEGLTRSLYDSFERETLTQPEIKKLIRSKHLRELYSINLPNDNLLCHSLHYYMMLETP